MRLFIDTGSVSEVEEIAPWGVLSGATTNPSLLAREHGDPGQALCRICEAIDGPVSAEVVAEDRETMAVQGRALRGLHEHVVVKVPFGPEGLAATARLAAEGIDVNVTLVFSAAQALLAAQAGARYVSCFLGRLDDVAVDSEAVLGEIVQALRGDGGPDVLAASVRSPGHVVCAARLGCGVATIPAAVLRQMLGHPLTAAGIARFEADWAARPELAEWLEQLTGRPRLTVAAR